ncbi:BHH_G0046400.mRNA.1.CDS.1 [Saccharomyces cerevisiae]|nr:BHH_G0046400.mRNA.1.CDS.1 [Saccharomyces cerevisiae]CAI7313584.1 BHH_G0046400.mRNA.1.CDS.1 [Saccharomyces cerevisiae]
MVRMEVFVLMEYCERGGLIDFMNTRLQNRLHEFEILQTMSQVTQGVAAMHALQPPLIHRDIKIGKCSYLRPIMSTSFVTLVLYCGIIRPPRNSQELSYVQQDILKNTTAQYRSPEMIDTFRGLPIR